MCCFCLHFYDFNVLFFQKNKKTCCSLLLKKLTCCAKREKKITCREEKSQPPPPPDIKWSVPKLPSSGVPELRYHRHRNLFLCLWRYALRPKCQKSLFIKICLKC